MRNASRRRVAAFSLASAAPDPVLYLVDDGGIRGYAGAQAAAEEEALPRWLVRQVGYVEGAAAAMARCCPECRVLVADVAHGQMDMWCLESPPVE